MEMLRYKWTIAVAVAIAALGGALYYLWPHASNAYSNADFTSASSGQSFAFDGAPNVFLGSFLLPSPGVDVQLRNGVTAAIAEKNVLSAFPSSVVYYDTNNSNTFNDGEGVVSSANINIEPGDTVLTTANNTLTSVATTEGPSFLIYLDQGATSSGLDAGEDVYNEVYNASGMATSDGTTVTTFANTSAFFDNNNNNSIDIGSFTSTDDGESFISDNDADGRPSAGDTRVGNARANVGVLTNAMNVCFDGSVVNDVEYDPNEIVWLDVAGDCTSFTSGADVILLGNASPSGTSTEFQTEAEVAFLDADSNGSFTCTRAGQCEALVYSGTNGTDWSTNQNLYDATIFFDGSTEATNGIAITGTSWDESGGLEDLVTINTLMVGPDPVYLTNSGGGAFATGSDVFKLVFPGAASAAATGQTLRTFDSDEKLLFVPGQSAYSGSNAAFVKSADAHLTAGALNGSGTDRVIISANNVLKSFPSSTKYHDHDASGSYLDGDDLVQDSDGSGYYNADDLLTLAVDVLPSGNSISDSNITAIKIYELIGSKCGGDGQDTLIGSANGMPLLNQPIAITKAPYASSDSVTSRTVCIFADAANVATHGAVSIAILGAGDADFSSTGTSPSADFQVVSSATQFVGSISANIMASSLQSSATATYTVSFSTVEDAIPTNGGVQVVFPAGYSTASATMTCTDDGVAVTGTQVVTTPSIRFTNSGSSVATGSTVSCTISGVTNPSTAGTTGTFIVRTYADNGASRGLEVDIDNTLTITGRSSGSEYIAPSAQDVTLVSPNGGEEFAEGEAATLTWTSTATTFVNLDYSTDGGATWSAIVHDLVDGGSYVWTVPGVDTTSALVRVTATDLVTETVSDTSDAVFAITSDGVAGDGEVGGEDEESPVVIDDLSGIVAESYIMGELASTVYYVDPYMARRPFLDVTSFLSYGLSFDDVVLVTGDVLEQLPLGAPMLPKPGVVLVKIQSSPKVYWMTTSVDGRTQLLVLSDEEAAIRLFGERWSDYVVDIPPTMWEQFLIEDALGGDENIDTSALRKRYEIDGIDDTDGDGYDDTLEVGNGYDPMRIAPARL